MKKLTAVLLAMLFIKVATGLTGCLCQFRDEATKAGKNMIKAPDRARLAKLKLLIREFDMAVATFKIQYDRNPGSLGELVEKRTMNSIPAEPFGGHWIYDSNTGKVKSSSHPDI